MHRRRGSKVVAPLPQAAPVASGPPTGVGAASVADSPLLLPLHQATSPCSSPSHVHTGVQLVLLSLDVLLPSTSTCRRGGRQHKPDLCGVNSPELLVHTLTWPLAAPTVEKAQGRPSVKSLPRVHSCARRHGRRPSPGPRSRLSTRRAHGPCQVGVRISAALLCVCCGQLTCGYGCV